MSYTIFDSLHPELQNRFKRVKLFLSDVDGVLTDATTLMGKGIELKKFHVMDGLGLRILMENGIQVGWISNRPSEATAARAEELGITLLSQQRGDKILFTEDILKKTGLSWEDTCYIGDDIVDIGMFRKTPLAIAVRNAHPLLIEMADYVTIKKGGNGAIREVCELILMAQNKCDNLEFFKRGL